MSRTLLVIVAIHLAAVSPAVRAQAGGAAEDIFETYEGDHTNRVAERFAGWVLPFFSAHLEFE